MLLKFRVSNHKSIRDEVELSLIRHPRFARHHEPPVIDFPYQVSTVAAVYGANASGKSNLIDALAFMASAVEHSFGGRSAHDPVPMRPFLLGDGFEDVVSSYEVELLLDGVRYQYGFALTRARIEREWLYAYPHGRRQVWFERDAAQADAFYFGKSLPGHNRTIADLTRGNALFLSAASASNHERLAPIGTWFRRGLQTQAIELEERPHPEMTEFLRDDDARQHVLLALLAYCDLGIDNLDVTVEEFSEEGRARAIRIARAFTDDRIQDDDLSEFLDRGIVSLKLLHSGMDGQRFGLPLGDESRGTRALVALAGPMFAALDSGSTLVVDELDTSIHTRLLAEIVELFQSPKSNPKAAQLIFTTHDTSLLGDLGSDHAPLDRDQIWFTVKSLEGVTELYPLTDFHPRKNENLQRGYLQGRYGAVPITNPSGLVEAMQDRGC